MIQQRGTSGWLRSILDLPEFNVLVFAILLNSPWEFLQAPFFKDMPGLAHWAGIQRCTMATAGDGLLTLVAFWSTAVVARTRAWILRPTRRHVLIFIGVGLTISIVIERFATSMNWPPGGWSYADTMPVLPVLDIGLTPFLQWIILPPLAVWFVRRQLT